MFLRYLNFCDDLLGHIGKGVIKKLTLILKIMTSPTGKQIITINILTNISRNKVNQRMKFGQLIECNVRNISLYKNHTKNKSRRIVPNLFFLKKKTLWVLVFLESQPSALGSFFKKIKLVK